MKAILGGVIRLEEVSKAYDGKVALEKTTLSVPPEGCLAIIGPSGCGKSTLLRLVMGLIEPDTGRISINGTPMTSRTARELRLRLGYMVQDGGLFPHLTAEGNIALLPRRRGLRGERLKARIRELSDLTRMPVDLLDRYPAQLSGGQRQRVGLMRALVLDPEVLLLDEPLVALDPMVRSRLQEDLREIFQRLKKTVLLVTHDMGEAAYLGDEIALLREGRMVQRGKLADLLLRPAEPFVAEFIRAQRPVWIEETRGSP